MSQVASAMAAVLRDVAGSSAEAQVVELVQKEVDVCADHCADSHESDQSEECAVDGGQRAPRLPGHPVPEDEEQRNGCSDNRYEHNSQHKSEVVPVSQVQVTRQHALDPRE